MAKFTLDPKKPPRLSPEERERLHAMTPAEIEAAARSDPDNPPLTTEELLRLKGVRLIKAVRARTGLPQGSFATTFHINLSRLRDLEQGRTEPDSAMEAYLKVIAKDPAYVAQALEGA